MVVSYMEELLYYTLRLLLSPDESEAEPAAEIVPISEMGVSCYKKMYFWQETDDVL